jgi:hypothetical protein
MKFKRGLGIFLFLIGVFILISSQSGMTGNVVSERVSAVSSVFGLVFIIGGMILFIYESKEEKIYHGTCRAFVEFAEQQGGKFGPKGRELYFTPDLNHAKMFANSWNTKRGIKLLKDYFGDLPKQYAEPVVLEYDQNSLGQLEKKLDAGAVEMVKKGPVQLGKRME